VLDWGWCDREINAWSLKRERPSLWCCWSTFVHVSRLLYRCVPCIQYNCTYNIIWLYSLVHVSAQFSHTIIILFIRLQKKTFLSLIQILLF
jgi:hypothetical protein